MSTPRLGCLPVELMHRICTYCERPEIRSLRRTARTLGAVADEYFLDHITVFYERGDMEMAESIVANRSIAQCVRTLRFQADRLLRVYNYKLWDKYRKAVIKQMAIIKGQLPNPATMVESSKMSRQSRRELLEAKRALALERDRHSKDELKFAFEHFRQLLDDQDKLMKEERAQVCMTRILEACPKLDSIAVTMGNDEDLLKPVPWQNVAAFKKALVAPWRDHVSNRINTRPTNETLTATSNTGRRLKSLTLAPIDHHFFNQSEVPMVTIYGGISDLEQLRIRIDHNWHQSKDDSATYCAVERKLVKEGIIDETDRQCKCDRGEDDEDHHDDRETNEDAARRVMRSYINGRLVRFFSKTPNLRELHFEGPMPFGYVEPLQLSYIFGDMHWEHLSRLELTNFRAREKELIRFLLSYSSTLKHLTLQYAVIDGSWRKVLRNIGGKFPELQTVCLRGVFEDEDYPFRVLYDPEQDSDRRLERTQRFIISGDLDDFV